MSSMIPLCELIEQAVISDELKYNEMPLRHDETKTTKINSNINYWVRMLMHESIKCQGALTVKVEEHCLLIV